MDRDWLVFWVVLAVIVWALGYGVACFIWPYTDCRKCKGGGKFRSPSGKAWRRCRRCKGVGVAGAVGPAGVDEGRDREGQVGRLTR